MTKHVITEYDREAREWVEVLPKDEKKAMKYVLSKINRKPNEEKDVKHIEKSALKRLEMAAPANDAKIFKFLGSRLDSTINSKNVGWLTYVKWPKSIEINGPRDIVNVYTQFREGEGYKDDSSYLSELGMDLKQFEAWLVSKGAKKVSKPKRKPNYTLYD